MKDSPNPRDVRARYSLSAVPTYVGDHVCQNRHALNDLPIAKGNTHSGTVTRNFDIITPNRIFLGRNNRRGLSGEGIDFEASANLQRLPARSHDIFSMWYRLYIENLLNAPAEKWSKSDPLLNPGDIVLFVVLESASGSKKNVTWRLGKVLSATDRKVKIEQVLKSGMKTFSERNPRDVSAIVVVDSLAITTRDYFTRLLEVERSPSKLVTL